MCSSVDPACSRGRTADRTDVVWVSVRIQQLLQSLDFHSAINSQVKQRPAEQIRFMVTAWTSTAAPFKQAKNKNGGKDLKLGELMSFCRMTHQY